MKANTRFSITGIHSATVRVITAYLIVLANTGITYIHSTRVKVFTIRIRNTCVVEVLNSRCNLIDMFRIISLTNGARNSLRDPPI